MDFEMIQLENEKPNEVIIAKYELRKNHFFYQTEYYSTEKNEDLGMWEDKYTNLTMTISKPHISGIELGYMNEKWKLTIKQNINSDSSVWIFYKNHKDAKKAFDEIYDWLYNIYVAPYP